MKVVTTIKDVREHVSEARRSGKKIGFVPTMGYLHRAHMSLVEASKEYSQYQVMSIFVNRMQFNDPADFGSYPRDLDHDLQLAREQGVDLVFVPDDTEMYTERLTYVDVELITENLCGATRPGHFRGVLTVVSKLFNIVQPDVSVFGQKDIQQAVSIEKMVHDLNFPVKIIVAPIIREEGGLAMSSRNKNLTDRGWKDARALHQSLQRAEEMLLAGERNSAVLCAEIERIIKEGGPDKIDYISVVRYSDLSLIDSITEKSAIAVSAFFGMPKLLDNMIIEFKDGIPVCIY